AGPIRRIQRQGRAGLVQHAPAEEALAPLRFRNPGETGAQRFEHRAPWSWRQLQAAGGNGHGFHQYSGTIMGSPVAAPAGLRGCRVALYPDPPASISASCDGPPAANGGKTMAIDLGQRPTSDLCQHPAWQSLAGSQPGRRQAWRCILDEAVPPDQLAEIRRYLQQQRALGRDAFEALVEAKTRRFASARPAHRPCKRAEGGADQLHLAPFF